MLGINPHFFEPMEDLPTDMDDAEKASDVDEDEIELDELPVNVGGKPILPATMDDD